MSDKYLKHYAKGETAKNHKWIDRYRSKKTGKLVYVYYADRVDAEARQAARDRRNAELAKDNADKMESDYKGNALDRIKERLGLKVEQKSIIESQKKRAESLGRKATNTTRNVEYDKKSLKYKTSKVASNLTKKAQNLVNKVSGTKVGDFVKSSKVNDKTTVYFKKPNESNSKTGGKTIQVNNKTTVTFRGPQTTSSRPKSRDEWITGNASVYKKDKLSGIRIKHNTKR